jgi:hypothetical protein
VCRRRCFEVNRTEVSEHDCALKNQRCNERILHDDEEECVAQSEEARRIMCNQGADKQIYMSPY